MLDDFAKHLQMRPAWPRIVNSGKNRIELSDIEPFAQVLQDDVVEALTSASTFPARRLGRRAIRQICLETGEIVLGPSVIREVSFRESVEIEHCRAIDRCS